MDPLEYAVEGLELDNKIILDAAVGAGRATAFWADKLAKFKASSKIIGVDIDLPPEWEEKVIERLGSNKRFVELVEGDIFSLDFLEDSSVDIINCGDTIIFLNPQPIKLLKALGEFKRILKPGGDLIITSEYPSKDLDKKEGQWKRWQLSQSISQLSGKTFSVEPGLEEVKYALKILGFEITGEKEFPQKKIENYREVMEEWKETWLRETQKIPWGERFRKTLVAEIESVYSNIIDAGYLLGPGKFVIKARKGLAGRG